MALYGTQAGLVPPGSRTGGQNVMHKNRSPLDAERLRAEADQARRYAAVKRDRSAKYKS